MIKKNSWAFDMPAFQINNSPKQRTQEKPRRMPDQFNVENVDKVRLEIDKTFLKAIAPELSEKDITEYLYDLYRYVQAALKIWV